MKVSYNWLNEYLHHKLPPVEKAAELLTMNSSEIDGLEKVDGDCILDVKILPNMAHSCLCHRGIAREFAVILGLSMKKTSRKLEPLKNLESSHLDLEVKIENPKDCRRYIGRIIENIKIGQSPEWLKHRLENLGQRSINNLVDATNFVLLEIGQPMHVFDADKIGGSVIEIKKAKSGDEMKTLDAKQVVLDDSVLVISNNNKALAIAGIKGGTLAEIHPGTKNIVLESANFDPVLIRKTAQKLKIQTDASKRYENDLTPDLAGEAMEILTQLILEIAGTPETKVGQVVDIYPNPQPKFSLDISAAEVEKVLGLKIADKDIEEIFRRFEFVFKNEKGKFTVEIPSERLDLRIKEDMIEEIGRIYGYDKLKDNVKQSTGKGQINKSFYYANKVRQILVEAGFSEIYGYAFAEKGDIEIANSVAPEKKFLRNNLTDGFKNYLEFNARYAELVNMPQIKIFEIGKVFKPNDEHANLAIGVKNPVGVKKPKENEVLAETLKILSEKLGLAGKGLSVIASGSEAIQSANIAEFNFTDLIAKLPEPTTYDVDLPMADKDMRFKKISAYPFILRDIAVFTPEEVLEDSPKGEKLLKIIKEEAGELLIKYRLFDTFKKDGKISYAFRLVFQSYEKTLSDEEINKIMDRVSTKLNAQKDWQVR